MSTKANPGPNSCYERALPDEPIFTLLGRDPAASFTILFWCKLRELMGKDAAQIDEAQACVAAMRDWAIKLEKGAELHDAFQAFRKACFEVAKAELEASKESTEPNAGTGTNPGAGI